MFIPPDGAMQFEYTNPSAPNCGTMQVYYKGKAPAVIWVKGIERNRGACGCKEVYRVLTDSLDLQVRLFVENKERETGGKFVVCACKGRIIE